MEQEQQRPSEGYVSSILKKAITAASPRRPTEREESDDEEIVQFETPSASDSNNESESDSTTPDPTIMSATTSPRIGGLMKLLNGKGDTIEVPFLGGTNLKSDSKKIHSNCLRAGTIKGMETLDAALDKGCSVELEYHNTPEERTRNLAEFKKQLAVDLLKLGLRPVFLAFDPATGTETDLLKTTGTSSLAKAQEHEKMMRDGLMPWVQSDGTFTYGKKCEYDEEGLENVKEFLLSSFGPELKKMYLTSSDENEGGVCAWHKATTLMTPINSRAVRNYVKALEDAKLSDVAGENALKFKMDVIDPKLQLILGSGTLITDLTQVVVDCFIRSSVETYRFRLQPVKKKYANVTDMDMAEGAAKECLNEYDIMVKAGDWPPANGIAGAQANEEAAMGMTGQIVQQQNWHNYGGRGGRGNSGGGRQSGRGRGGRFGRGGGRQITCNTCGGFGHKFKDCPTEVDEEEETNSDGLDFRGVAPAQGEPLTKTVDGVTYGYCPKCNGGKGFWTCGNSFHLEADHQSGWNRTNGRGAHRHQENLAAAAAAAEALASAPTPAPAPAPTPAAAGNLAVVNETGELDMSFAGAYCYVAHAGTKGEPVFITEGVDENGEMRIDGVGGEWLNCYHTGQPYWKPSKDQDGFETK